MSELNIEQILSKLQRGVKAMKVKEILNLIFEVNLIQIEYGDKLFQYCYPEDNQELSQWAEFNILKIAPLEYGTIHLEVERSEE